MHVLIIKTSSLGDVIHTLPALTDAAQRIDNISFDWVVEENFAEIPSWHPQVKQVIPIAWRRWRKSFSSPAVRKEFFAFIKRLRQEQYDLIIDAQGLIKSAVFAFLAKGERAGFNWSCARESLASIFYHHKCDTPRVQHAVTRTRQLFAQALHYRLDASIPDYGIDKNKFVSETPTPYLLFAHGTTWATKMWPEIHWIELAKLANQQGYNVKLPWGTQQEFERAERIANACDNVEVLPKQNLLRLAQTLAGAKAVAAVDTGLTHLAAALDVPTVSLYGPTNPALSGALGRQQIHLSANFPCVPCLSRTCHFGETNPSATYKSPFTAECFFNLKPVDVWAAMSIFISS